MGAKTERRAVMSINVGGGELRELKPRILVEAVAEQEVTQYNDRSRYARCRICSC